MDLDLGTRAADAQKQIAAFVRDTIIPMEARAFASYDDEIRNEAQTAGRAAGLWAPQLPEHLGGMGFTFTETAALFEEAGYSLLGPLAVGVGGLLTTPRVASAGVVAVGPAEDLAAAGELVRPAGGPL